MIKKRLLFSLMLFSFLLIGCKNENVSNDKRQQDKVPEAEERLSKDAITFIVAVPSNTPEEDIIFMENYQPEGIVANRMEKIGPHTHKISFMPEDIEQSVDKHGNAVYYYRYNRNDYGFIAAEYIEPDGYPDGTAMPRSVLFIPGKIYEDKVERWRWFPEGEINYKTYIEPNSDFPSRIDDIEFRSGQAIQDLYVPAFDNFFDSTAKHIKEMGYKWVVLMPPWQWVESEPLPKVANSIELGFNTDPNYLNDEKLKEHIRAFKNNGLNVHLAPQICCTEIDKQGRSKEWWQEYSREVERFLVHHARLAEEEKVDSFLFDVFGDKGKGFDNPEVRYKEILYTIKNEFSGEIGSSVAIWMDENKVPNGIIPQANFFTFADELDFFILSTDAKVSLEDTPNDEELEEGAGNLMDYAKVLYDTYKKPIVVQTAYASAEQSWKGASGIDFIKSMNTPWFPEKDSKYNFSGQDQAMVFNAYFEAIAERPWIIGLYNFGYWNWEMPLAPDISVRGKQAENLWQKWNEIIYNNG